MISFAGFVGFVGLVSIALLGMWVAFDVLRDRP